MRREMIGVPKHAPPAAPDPWIKFSMLQFPPCEVNQMSDYLTERVRGSADWGKNLEPCLSQLSVTVRREATERHCICRYQYAEVCGIGNGALAQPQRSRGLRGWQQGRHRPLCGTRGRQGAPQPLLLPLWVCPACRQSSNRPMRDWRVGDSRLPSTPMFLVQSRCPFSHPVLAFRNQGWPGRKGKKNHSVKASNVCWLPWENNLPVRCHVFWHPGMAAPLPVPCGLVIWVLCLWW